jgi:hypothetical protein
MRRKTQVAAQQVLAQILTLQPPDPPAVLLGALGVNTSEVRRRLDVVTPDSRAPSDIHDFERRCTDRTVPR